MSVSHTSSPATPFPPRQEVDARYLHQVISTVSSTLDLDRVMHAIVDLVSEAIDCHACFVYTVDPVDESLVLRAVSDPYGELEGRLRLQAGEGLAGWVAEHNEPVFLPEGGSPTPGSRWCRRPRRRSTSRWSPCP